MNEVGEKLKEARKAKGYTLDDLQQMTKIQKRYLIAVEEGNLEVLPGNFYARAFIKQYADTVGLDGEELLKNHSDIPATKDENYTQNIRTTQTRSKAKSGGIGNTIQESLPTILIILLVFAIMGGFYWAAFRGADGSDPLIPENPPEEESVEVGSNEEAAEENASDEETQSEEEPADENSEDSTDETEENPEEPEEELTIAQSASTGGATTYTVSGTQPETQQITLTAEGGDTWVSVAADGTTLEQSLLTDGNSLTSELGQDVQTVTVVIGNAAATAVQLNGQSVEYAEEAANAVRQELVFEFE